MYSIPGTLNFLFPKVHSQAFAAFVSSIGKYPSTLSCSISLFSYRCRYVWSLLLHRIHVSHTTICALSRIISTFFVVALGLRRVLTILAPLSVYFLLLSYVPLPDGIVSSGMSDTFTLVTARYNVLGIFILGSLSGFGSVTTAWGYFPLRCGRNRHVDDSCALSLSSANTRCLGRFQPKQNLTAQSRVLLASVPILIAREEMPLH